MISFSILVVDWVCLKLVFIDVSVYGLFILYILEIFVYLMGLLIGVLGLCVLIMLIVVVFMLLVVNVV